MNKEVLIKQFDRSYDVNGWFVSIRKAIDGLTAEQADWNASNAENSVWETISHITYYNNAYLQRFKGVDFEYDVANNDETFKGSVVPSEEAWEKTVAEFDAVMSEWRQALSGAESSRFEEPVPNKGEYTWAELIADINTHNAYHAGQIVLTRKLQGSWNPEKGVS